MVYAFLEEFYIPDNYSVNTVDRYYVMHNALMSKADTLIVEMMNGLRRLYLGYRWRLDDAEVY